MPRSWCSLVVLLAACRDTVTPAVTEPPVPLPATVARLAVVRDVPLTAAATAVTHASVLGRDAIDVELDGVRRSMVGEFAPGRIRVTASVRLVNRLTRTVLVRPTFPSPPPGEERLLLFVASATAVDVGGGVSSAANVTQVTVPGTGSVSPSPDWDGPPWDYLRGTSCRPPAATCARYEPFGAPLAAGASSAWRTIGFDVEPQVRAVRLHLVLAADLANAP